MAVLILKIIQQCQFERLIIYRIALKIYLYHILEILNKCIAIKNIISVNSPNRNK